MATVAERYGLPLFTPDAAAEKLRGWARHAAPSELVREHKAMRECIAQWPRYLKMLAWLETVADLRKIDLSLSYAR
jgi:hypothetical protein